MKQMSARSDLKRFERGLDRWGADLRAWPSPDRAMAEALLAGDAEARRRFEAARRVEAALGELMRPGPAEAPMRLVHSAPTVSLRRIAGWSTVGLAASLLIGFAAGTMAPLPDDDDDTAGQVFSAVQDADGGSGDVL